MTVFATPLPPYLAWRQLPFKETASLSLSPFFTCSGAYLHLWDAYRLGQRYNEIQQELSRHMMHLWHYVLCVTIARYFHLVPSQPHAQSPKRSAAQA